LQDAVVPEAKLVNDVELTNDAEHDSDDLIQSSWGARRRRRRRTAAPTRRRRTTAAPTAAPSAAPTDAPTPAPTAAPTAAPTTEEHAKEQRRSAKVKQIEGSFLAKEAAAKNQDRKEPPSSLRKSRVARELDVKSVMIRQYVHTGVFTDKEYNKWNKWVHIAASNAEASYRAQRYRTA